MNVRPRASIPGFPVKHAVFLCGLWLLVSLVPTLARFSHPAFGVQGDLPLHYHFLRSFVESLNEGDFWPRWAGLLDGGHGDALFTYYPPLFFLIGGNLIRLFDLEILTSLMVLTLLSFMVAQASAYLFAREFFSDRDSVVVSLCYVLLPAYPLIAVHRAFLPNALALGLAPLALLGAHRLLLGREPTRAGLMIFVSSFSAIVLTHTITTYLCGTAVGLLTLTYLASYDRRHVGRGVVRLAAGGLIVAGLTAFSLWPMWVEKDWVQIGANVALQDYHSYFLFAQSSDSRPYRRAWAELNTSISVMTLFQTLIVVLLATLCRQMLWRTRDVNSRVVLVRFALVMTAFGLLISLPISEPAWRYLPGLQFIQFPWRFQPFVALACGLIGAAAISQWSTIGRRGHLAAAAALTGVIVVNGAFIIAMSRLNEPATTATDVAALLKPFNGAPISSEEAETLNADDRRLISFLANQIAYRPASADSYLYPPATQPGSLTFVSGHGRVMSEALEMARREFHITVHQPGRVRVNTYYYPHWVARLDGREVAIGVNRTAGAEQGLMVFDLPTGEHQLTLDFEVRHKGELAARGVSLACWLIFAIWSLWTIPGALRQRRNHLHFD
jgi:hypothetical protein